MVAEQSPRPMTVDEWRALERSSHDVKHEYIDGYVYAMAGGTLAHARIASNIVGALDAALGDGPCIAYAMDAAARLSASRYTYPDVVVACEEGAGVARREETEVAAPRLVVEVLSDSTEQYDRSLRFAYYRDCPSLEEYVLVGTAYQTVEVYRRTGGVWNVFHVYGPGDQIELAGIKARFPVSACYRRADVPETPPARPGAGGHAAPDA